MKKVLVAALLGTLAVSSLGAQTDNQAAPANETAAQRLERIRAANAARNAQYQADLQRYNQESARVQAEQARSAEAQRRYQEDVARHNQEVERSEQARRDYERRRAEYDERTAGRHGSRANEDARAASAAATTAPVAAETDPSRCEQRRQRNRRRGRVIGGIVGGVAGSALGRGSAVSRLATVALSAPVGALIGDAIASLLDCDEQRQAAAATEQAVRSGVGSTVTWQSASRPGVTGSSTVTAAEPAVATASNADACLTVTDIVIVDGEETRAPKRMCRRPPANRYVRV